MKLASKIPPTPFDKGGVRVLRRPPFFSPKGVQEDSGVSLPLKMEEQAHSGVSPYFAKGEQEYPAVSPPLQREGKSTPAILPL